MSLAVALEHAAAALEADADEIRPANGDPARLLTTLSVDARVRVLAWLLGHESEAGAELAESWSEEPDGVASVLAVPEGSLPKDGRKALRRILHRLRGRGVAVPKSEPAPLTATLPKLEDAIEAALLSPLDPTGARLAYLVESSPGGGARIFEIIFDAGRGILECSVYSAGRSGARKFLREAEGRGGAMPVDPGSVRKLVGEAAAAHPAERALPRGFAEWRSRLTSAPPGTRTPGEEVREALGAGGGSVPRAIEMVKAREIGPWPLPEAPLRALAERLQDLSKARIVLTAPQREAQIDAALAAALEDTLDEAGRARMAGRFAETAFFLWKQGREDDARACLAAAAGFGDTPPGENPVARALLEGTLAPLLERLREEEDSSLIVKP